MSSYLRTLTCALLFAAPSFSQDASYTALPAGIGVNDITPDGRIVVGAGNGQAHYWRWQEDPAPTFIGSGTAAAISDDGTVIAGTITDSITGVQEAARWTATGGWQLLGGVGPACDSFWSSSFDMSADGSTIVGLGWNGCSAVGFLWTESGGMQTLEVLANGSNRASAIAGNGSILGGFAQGSFSRTPATWQPDLTGQVYDIDALGEVHGISADGSTVLGEWNGSAFYTVDDDLFPIGNLNGPGWTGIAQAAAENLSRVVGFDILGTSREAWTWTPSGGIQSLLATLTTLGVPGLPGSLHAAVDTSADGTVVIGNNFFTSWIVTLPPITGWNQYGVGAAAVNAMDLDGGGDATLGGVFTATTSDVVGSATATFIALDSGNFPLFGGQFLLDPLKLVNPVLIEATAGGATTSVIPLPNDVSLAGVSVFFQSLAEDGGQPFGFAFSNGLELTLGV